MNHEAVTFIYWRDGKATCLYPDAARRMVGDKNYKHVATINPALWIQHFLNNPKERRRQIKSISAP